MNRTSISNSFILFFYFSLFLAVSSFGGSNCDPIPDIDGLSSASSSFKIITGTVCDTFANITWTDTYSNGTVQRLRYGTTQSYDNAIELKPFSAHAIVTTTIPKLVPGIMYYAQFNRQFGNIIRNVSFTFTTGVSQTGIQVHGPSYELELANRFKVFENVLYLNSQMHKGDILFITDMKGKKIFGYEHEVDISKIKLPAIAHGMYTVTQVRNNKVIHGNRVTIGLAQ